jgi:hypothetical protein
MDDFSPSFGWLFFLVNHGKFCKRLAVYFSFDSIFLRIRFFESELQVL